MKYTNAKFSMLLGKIITDIEHDSTKITFTLDDGTQYEMSHVQDCCERVSIEDVCGNFSDLLDTPVLRAEERSQGDLDADGHRTWTFYELATIKGSVTTRWYGESNGYYSEAVSFMKKE